MRTKTWQVEQVEQVKRFAGEVEKDKNMFVRLIKAQQETRCDACRSLLGRTGLEGRGQLEAAPPPPDDITNT